MDEQEMLPMSTLTMYGGPTYEIVDKKARDKIEELDKLVKQLVAQSANS